MVIKDIVSDFNAIPFLFVGSGISRRYLGLPDWKGLLDYFARKVNDDEFSFNIYESRARGKESEYGLLPKVAELIQKDYDEKWFADSSIRNADQDKLQMVRNGVSPFKVEIAVYLESIAKIQEVYSDEIQKLHFISEKSIAGVITTNYDFFLEDNLCDFTKYIGQSQLIFAPIQGVAEIYKIHGSIEQPESLVITEKDYKEFDQKSSYLIAKLMTIFVEHPIIFIGYSINDKNVQNIINGIVDCLDDDQLGVLQNRFVFVEYEKDYVGAEVTPYTIMINGRPLNLMKIVLDDFGLLYSELENKKAKLPVRLLRRFKQELYDFTISHKSTGNLRVATLDDERVSDEDMVLAIGTASELGLRGLSGISGNEWYRNVVLEDLKFENEELLTYAFPCVVKQFSKKIPIHKYLVGVESVPIEVQQVADDMYFDNIISPSNKKNRKYLGDYSSVKQIWESMKTNRKKAFRFIAYLTEDQIDVDELELVLREIFNDDANVLENVESAEKTSIRLLIRIYDYLKWGKQKNLPN